MGVDGDETQPLQLTKGSWARVWGELASLVSQL